MAANSFCLLVFFFWNGTILFLSSRSSSLDFHTLNSYKKLTLCLKGIDLSDLLCKMHRSLGYQKQNAVV